MPVSGELLFLSLQKNDNKMIQRIQSVYLFLALLCMVMLIFFPVADFFTIREHVYELRFNGLIPSESYPEEFMAGTWPLTALIITIIVILVADIFLFKNRMLQMRLTVYNIVLMFGLLGMIYYYMTQLTDVVNALTYTIYPTVLMPLISAILLMLAFRGIRKDELLIRSLNRIR